MTDVATRGFVPGATTWVVGSSRTETTESDGSFLLPEVRAGPRPFTGLLRRPMNFTSRRGMLL